MIIPSRPRAFGAAAAGAALLVGVLAALHYHRLGLTLSHYDARGHLVVARRVVDSLTPGWQQIGAVWLPLPHLLNLIPVQVDAFYRNGASAVAISIAAFALAAGSLAWLILLITGSRWAAVAGVAAFALNPNVLYLQSTPMTELLLIGLIVLGVTRLAAWCSRAPDFDRAPRPAAVGVIFALACLTRYEAWPATAAALILAALAIARMGMTPGEAVARASRIAVYPAVAILAFSLFSRVVIGEWFVSSGFFVPDNPALGRPVEALVQIGWGVSELSGEIPVGLGAVGLCALAVIAAIDRPRAWAMVPLSLVATAALPWAAFSSGHPYRIRYMVPLLAAQALGVGVAAGLAKRGAPAVALALFLFPAVGLRPADVEAPIIVEAQWDRPNVPERQRVTDCLRAAYAGETIMASMGSLGHYMQELAVAGFDIEEFLHEGNGDVWLAALERPVPYAGWILIEEQAEGGDMLAAIARGNPRFLEGFSRVCEGAGVALYKRGGRPHGAAPAEERRLGDDASGRFRISP